MEDGSVKEGYLVKEGSKRKTWKRRYFVLTRGDSPTLAYFTSAKKVGQRALSVLLLETCSDVRHVDPPKGSSDNQFYFELDFPSRTLRAYADTEDDREEWTLLISRCMDSCQAPPKVQQARQESRRTAMRKALTLNRAVSLESTAAFAAFREGYLYKLGSKTKQWKRRWFALYEDALLFYETKDASKPLGQVRIVDCLGTGDAGGEQGDEFAFEIITRHRAIILRAETEDDQQSWIRALSLVISSEQQAATLRQLPERRGAGDGKEATLRTRSQLLQHVTQPMRLRQTLPEGLDSDAEGGDGGSDKGDDG